MEYSLSNILGINSKLFFFTSVVLTIEIRKAHSIDSFHMYLLNAHCIPETVLGIESKAMKSQSLYLHEAYDIFWN